MNDEQLEDEAIHWIVTLTSGDASEEKLAEFRCWRQLSDQHERAFQSARDLWLSLGKSEQLYIFDIDIKHPNAVLVTDSIWQQRIYNRFPFLKKVSNRLLLLLMVIVLITYYLLVINSYDYATNYGEINELKLDDGSRVTLNSHSAIDVHYNNKSREVILKRGEAFFDVAHQPQRPFIVKSGQSQIKVLGTAFSVDKQDDQITVTVVRGKVQVSDATAQSQNLVPQQQVIMEPGKPFHLQQVNNLSLELSWRNGRLNFANKSLEDILDDLQKYDKRKWIVYLDSSTAHALLNTTVNIHDIDEWLGGIQTILPNIKVKNFGSVLIIYS